MNCGSDDLYNHVFLNIVEFIGETREILRLYHLSYMLWSVCRFSITVVVWEWLGIISMSPVLLNLAWLINMWLSIFLKAVRCGWMISWQVHIWSDVEVSVFALTNTYYLMTRLAQIGNRIWPNSNTFLVCLSKDSCHFKFVNNCFIINFIRELLWIRF